MPDGLVFAAPGQVVVKARRRRKMKRAVQLSLFAQEPAARPATVKRLLRVPQ